MERALHPLQPMQGAPPLSFSTAGKMAVRLLAFDWSRSTLGPRDQWPQSLKTTLGILLDSHLPTCLWWGADLTNLYNDACVPILGHHHPQALGRPAAESWFQIWPVIGPELKAARESGQPGGRLDALQVTIKRDQVREERWFSLSYSPVHDERGQVAGLLCILHEETQRVLAEHRLRAFLENAPPAMGIVELAPDDSDVFHIVDNVATEHFFGVGPGGTGGRWAQRELGASGETIRTWAAAYREAQRSGHTVRFHYAFHPSGKGKNGPSERRWLDASVSYVGPGEAGRDRFCYAAIDDTERRQAETALEASEERFRTLADNISQLAWMADPEGWIFWYNRRWYDYTETTFEQMEGWGWKEVHHPDHVERVVARIQHAWDTGEPWEDTFPLRGKDGRYRWFLSRAVPIRDAQGRIVRWFGTNTDVTQQRAAEEALRASDRRKDEFLATLAHELRNPLAPRS